MSTHRVIIVNRHASGADSLGERFAAEYGLQTILIPTEWDKYGRSASPKRNAQMAEIANVLIAFWDGNSKGTQNIIQIAKQKNIPVRIVSI